MDRNTLIRQQYWAAQLTLNEIAAQHGLTRQHVINIAVHGYGGGEYMLPTPKARKDRAMAMRRQREYKKVV